MGVYKVFGSNNLTLLFYNVYLCFICDLRRDSSKRKYWNVHIWNCSSSFLLDITNKFCVIISKRLYYTSLKLNCNFSKACVPLSPTDLTEGCTVLPWPPVALFICQFMLSVDFFLFWLLPWEYCLVNVVQIYEAALHKNICAMLVQSV